MPLTGRTRRIEGSGTFLVPAAVNGSWDWCAGPFDQPPGVGFPYDYLAKTAATIINWSASGTISGTPFKMFDFDATSFVRQATADCADGGVAGARANLRFRYPSSSGSSSVVVSVEEEGASGGEFSFYVDVEETIFFAPVPGFSGGTIGGAVETQVPAHALVVGSKLKEGGEWGISITVGSTTDSDSGTITHAQSLGTIQYVSGEVVDAYAIGDLGGNLASASRSVDAEFTCDLMGETAGRVETDTEVDGAVTTGLDFTAGVFATVTSDHATGLSGNNPGQCIGGYGGRLKWQVPKRGEISGQINEFDTIYPDTLDCELVTNLGVVIPFTPAFDLAAEFDLLNEQCYYGKGLVSPGLTYTLLVEQLDGDGVSAYVTAAAMTAAGEDPSGRGLPLGLPPFDALELSQASTYEFDPCSSATGWTSNATLVGGNIRVDSSANAGYGVGAAAKSYASIVITEGYRYLEVRVKPNSTSGGQLGIDLYGDGSSTAFAHYLTELPASGSFATIRIDLLAPTPGSTGATTKESRWPVKSTTLASALGTPVATGNTWGQNKISKIVLRFPASTGTYDLDYIRLARDENPRVTIIRSEATTKYVEAPSNSDVIYRGIFATTDHRVSLEFYGKGIGAGPYTQPLCVQFKMFADLIPGWTTTLVADSALWYYLPQVAYLAGGGVVWNGGDAPAPEDYWINKELSSSPTTIPAQVQVQGVYLSPQMGGLMSLTGFGTRGELFFWKFLRGRAFGVALNHNRDPIDGATVQLRQMPSGPDIGSGTTDVQGGYLTGVEHPKVAYQFKATLSGTGIPTTGNSLTVGVSARQYRRISFDSEVTSISTTCFIMEDDRGRYHRLSVQDGDVWYHRSDWAVPRGGWAVAVQVTDTEDCVRGSVAYWIQTQRLEMIFQRFEAGANSIWTCYSDDEGASWSTPELLMADALFPYNATGNDGSRFRVWFEYDSGTSGPGTAHGQYRGPADADWSTPFTFVDDAAADIPIADGGMANIAHGKSPQSPWLFSPVVDGETDISDWVSYDNGASWERVT